MNYNSLSLKKFRELFASLSPPEAASLRGVYRASFVGPGWLRASAGPALAVSGLGGWWGKEFSENGKASNIVLRAGKFSTRFSMELVSAKSLIDGKDGLALHYQSDNPFPWTHIVDELRRIDKNTVLGMTVADIAGLRSMSFPFLLEFQEHGNGL